LSAVAGAVKRSAAKFLWRIVKKRFLLLFALWQKDEKKEKEGINNALLFK
jgi:hypothetical protein